MTSTSQAIREMVKETCATVKKHAPSYEHLDMIQSRVENLSDDDLIARSNALLNPHANAIRSKDLNALDAAFSDLKLSELANMLPAEIVEKIWGDMGMLVMLLATVSLVPPDMLKQIEGFANAMASSMQGGNNKDIGMNLGAMFGNAFSNLGDEPLPNARARRNKPRNSRQNGDKTQLTAQEKFRRNLV